MSIIKDTEHKARRSCEIEDWEKFLIISKENFDKNWNKPCQYQETLKDFKLITLFGTGAFGNVLLVRRKQSKDYYAMKIMDKEKIVKCKVVHHIINEKLILQSIDFPLAVYLICSFKDNSCLYLVLPFVSGGDLFGHLKTKKHFNEDGAKFFASQITLAIEYLHYVDVVFRDLKPENILIDNAGYLKLTDFGHSKLMTKKRCYTLCGTPEYLAPEVIMCKPYGKSVDWWALGVLIYEMVQGISPFFSSDTMVTYEKIVGLVYKMPSSFSTDLKDLVKSLLQKDLSKRYGNLKNGVEDIKFHKWFATINWMAILNKKATPYFKPDSEDPEVIERSEPLNWNAKTSQTNLHPKDFEDF